MRVFRSIVAGQPARGPVGAAATAALNAPIGTSEVGDAILRLTFEANQNVAALREALAPPEEPRRSLIVVLKANPVIREPEPKKSLIVTLKANPNTLARNIGMIQTSSTANEQTAN